MLDIFKLAFGGSTIDVETIYLPTTTLTPNSPFPLTIYRNCFSGSPPPSSSPSPETIEEHFRAYSWIPEWRYSMFYQAHYHSTTHEVLGVYQGSALLRFGISDQEHESSELDDNGESYEEGAEAQSGTRNGPSKFKGYFAKVFPGDVVLIPAGVSHRLVKDLDSTSVEDADEEIPGLRFGHGVKLHNIPKLKLVGAYPKGAKKWDMCYGGEHARSSFGQIWVEIPDMDPVLGSTCLGDEGAKGIELWRKIESEGGVQKWLEGGVSCSY